MITPRTMPEQRGITLLLAVLFLTASLSISLGIFYIVLVQLQINRSARDSHIAFYAADTIKECAAYYREYVGKVDVDNDIDERGRNEGGFWSPDYPCSGGNCASSYAAPVCNGLSVLNRDDEPWVDYTRGELDNPNQPHIFAFKLDSAGKLCASATIKVFKTTKDADGNAEESTKIITEVDGWSSCNAAQPRVNQSFVECLSNVGACR